MKIKFVFRQDTIQQFYRLFRILWIRGVVGDGKGYSAKLSFAINPRWLTRIERDATTDWRVTIFGLRLHYCRSYAGIMI